jgi:hypothetical protein
MPFKSKAQARMMFGAAHNPAFAAKVGVPMAAAKKMVADSAGMSMKGMPVHASHDVAHLAPRLRQSGVK